MTTTATTRTIYATRTAGDRWTVTYSYTPSLDNEVTLAYIRRVAAQDRADVVLDRSGHRGQGEPETEHIPYRAPLS